MSHSYDVFNDTLYMCRMSEKNSSVYVSVESFYVDTYLHRRSFLGKAVEMLGFFFFFFFAEYLFKT